MPGFVTCINVKVWSRFRDMTQGKVAAHLYIEMDLDRAYKIADAAGATNGQERAEHFGLTPATWSRLTRRLHPASAQVIATVLHTRQELKFYDLFRVMSS